MRVTSWNCVCLADLERHAVAFPEQVERLADARRLMEEVLDAVGRGDEAKPTIGQTLDSASSRNHVVHPLREGPGRPSTCRVMPATVAHLSVSNSLSGRHWELDQVPAVGDRPPPGSCASSDWRPHASRGCQSNRGKPRPLCCTIRGARARAMPSHYPSWGLETSVIVVEPDDVDELITPHGDWKRGGIVLIRSTFSASLPLMGIGNGPNRRRPRIRAHELITPHGDWKRLPEGLIVGAGIRLITPHGDWKPLASV